MAADKQDTKRKEAKQAPEPAADKRPAEPAGKGSAAPTQEKQAASKPTGAATKPEDKSSGGAASKPGTSAPPAKKSAADKQSPADNKPASDNNKSTDKTEGPKTTDSSPGSTAAVKKPGLAGVWTTLIVLFILLAAALAGGAWYGWQRLQAEHAAIERVASNQSDAQQSLSGSVDQLQQRISQLQDQLQQQGKKLNQTQQDTAQRVTALEHNLARISDRLDRGTLAWRAAEIGFLLTRAQERLTISHDPRGAVVALNLADQRMADLSRPELLPVRSAISEVQTRLHKLDQVDRVGLALKLRQAADEVSSWPLAGADQSAASEGSSAQQASKTGQDQTSPTSATADQPWYQRIWQATRNWFGRQFTVTRSNEPVKTSARVATDRETRLWLTAVREALLARDSASVQRAVQAADQWIRPHYATDAKSVADALDTLQTARSAFARSQWPSMTAVFKAWNASGLSDPDKLVGRNPAKDKGQAAQGGAQ